MKRVILFCLLAALVGYAAGYATPRRGVVRPKEDEQVERTITVEGVIRLSEGSRRIATLERGFLGEDVILFARDVDPQLDGRHVQLRAVFAGSVVVRGITVRLWTVGESPG